jgi:hypothetical protein
MAEIHKIICDVCGEEANVGKDKTLGIFEYYSVRNLLTVTNVFKQEEDQNKIEKVKYDLCKSCLKKIENFILNELKKKE